MGSARPWPKLVLTIITFVSSAIRSMAGKLRAQEILIYSAKFSTHIWTFKHR